MKYYSQTQNDYNKSTFKETTVNIKPTNFPVQGMFSIFLFLQML